ncbi:phosphodiesterase [Nocardioides antri]|uniref:Phosphodiesterase n=1 Tax=Nocardioides antri TaxID=2607659 RepID=A0A5B1M0H7_9ACTN|nr:phosphodiesterase [Nocardioides antri]KAA1426433.1 phosphodiesterase [Nocardioides antri]
MEPPRTPSVPGLANDAAGAVGELLAGASRQLTKVRSDPKPLHPSGVVVTARLVRTGSAGIAVPWLEIAGTQEVVVRISRAIGLPGAVPDIHGLAMRVPISGRTHHADLLFASTGLGRVTRFMLTAGREITSRPLTTLLPYRSPRGPLLIGACPGGGDPLRFQLLWSRWLGPWVRFAELTVHSTTGPDPDISFDPIANPLPGLQHYEWVRRLRAPAYRAAREATGRA